MSLGLESIAMAAAHLERIGEGVVPPHHPNENHPEARASSPSSAAPPQSSTLIPDKDPAVVTASETSPTMASRPMVRPVGFGGTPRVVSQEYHPEDAAAAAPTAATSGSEAQHHPSNITPQAAAAQPQYPDAPSVSTTTTATTTTDPAVAAQQLQLLYPRPALVADGNFAGATPAAAPAKKTSNSRANNPNKIVRLRRDSGKELKDLQAYFKPSDFSKLSLAGLELSIPKATDVFSKVQDDDVIFGRGGSSNHHQGNIQYRLLVKACQPAYLAAKRRDKPRIAAGIVLAVRQVGGRFLKKEINPVGGDAASQWKDVGNNRAREKTSQALREGAPELRGTADSSSAPPAAAPTPAPAMGSYYHQHPHHHYQQQYADHHHHAHARDAASMLALMPKQQMTPVAAGGGMVAVPPRPASAAAAATSKPKKKKKQARRHTLPTRANLGEPRTKKQKRRSSLESLADAVAALGHCNTAAASTTADAPPAAQQQGLPDTTNGSLVPSPSWSSEEAAATATTTTTTAPPPPATTKTTTTTTGTTVLATVSGDDDDSAASSGDDHHHHPNNNSNDHKDTLSDSVAGSPRGPRIKLLKKRLQHGSDDGHHEDDTTTTSPPTANDTTKESSL